MNYEKGVCKICTTETYIVNKTKKLCQKCNNKRLLEKKVCGTSTSKESLKKTDIESFKKTAKISLSGGNKNAKANMDFYLQMWNSRTNHACEECGKRLLSFSPSYISHVLPKGAYPKLRYDIENVDFYCLQCHQIHEFGNRKAMKNYSQGRWDYLIRKNYGI